MKKALTLFACAALLMLLPAAALAETTDQTELPGESLGVTLVLPEERAPYAYRLTDAYIASRVSFRRKEMITIEPQGAAQLLVLNWYDAPASYTVSQLDAAGETIAEETITDGQLGKHIALDAACKRIVVLLHENGSLSGVAAYAADKSDLFGIPGFAPAPSQADLLIITAEPGMEFCQFGAVIPTYTKEKGVATAVLYVSDYGKRARAYEALVGLASAGYDVYPLFGGFLSDNYNSYKITTGHFNKRELTKYFEERIAALGAKVVVTHAISEETGAHGVVAECVLAAIQKCPNVEKLYLFDPTKKHNATIVEMNTPLIAYAGETASQVSQRAYEAHASRRIFGLVIDTASAYKLAYSTVGEDDAKNDLFEHIDTAQLISYAQATPSPTPTPEPTATPEPTPEPEAPAQTESVVATQDPLKADDIAVPNDPEGSVGGDNMPVLLSIGAGAALSLALFLLLFGRIRAKRGKGDAVCICLLPLALGLAIGATLAGMRESAPAAQPAAVSAAPQALQPMELPAPDDTPKPSPMPAPSESPEPTAALADLPDAQYYRSQSDPAEVIVVDLENGYWEYRSDDLGISIRRIHTKNKDGKPLTYFVADIHMRDISQFRPGFGAEGHTGRGAIYPWIIARREKAVLWITGDNLINDEREQKGILIRDGRMFWSGEKEDTLAIYPDMSLRIIKKSSMSPGMLLEDGVDNAFSFGPTLIDDGVINTQAKYHRVRRANPRVGIGYIAPGHYIAIVVDGRQKDYSIGMPVWELADLFAEYGCSIAYNLDGGLSAAMIFMGEQINSHSGLRIGDSNDLSFQRAVPDGLMFGYSEQVPSVDDPIANDGNKR
ncbi:MAG TPA: hypothetical protein DCY10_01785 [Clostridiales bacterium]|jgi:hypothetical protein|nr:hypothetical protein [Clostridiales bacterium]